MDPDGANCWPRTLSAALVWIAINLLPIARRIGFDPAEVLVDEANVDPLCVEHFNARGGILQPPEQINLKDIDTLFAQDLRLVDTV